MHASIFITLDQFELPVLRCSGHPTLLSATTSDLVQTKPTPVTFLRKSKGILNENLFDEKEVW